MSESFEYEMHRALDECKADVGTDTITGCYSRVLANLDRVTAAHIHEIQHIRKAEYHRGYEDGKRSMDAEHRAVALRLQQLPLDEDSHGNLSQIARALYHSDWGWTQGACRGLRDELIRLLGGVHDDPVPMGGDCCSSDADCVRGAGEWGRVTEYDVLDNERHKAVCELRKLDFEHMEQYGWMMWHALNKALGIETYDSDGSESDRYIPIRDRLIHLLGGDELTAMAYIKRIVREHDIKCLDMELSGTELSQASVDAMSRRAESDEGGEATITDELREYVSATWDGGICQYEIPKALCSIADHIDEEHERLRAKLDEYDKTHIELPKGKDGKHIRVGDTVQYEHGEPFQVTRIVIYDDDTVWVSDGDEYGDMPASQLHHAEADCDDTETIVRELTLNNITKQELIDVLREVLYGRC